ncbi:hypothetical protein [Pasteurella sp. PK-2025]|uniref:hypothetical protein n=1 Tax=Pasteurella sp. PK-2025 TaxID=3413133 RepID=UPI003C73E30B
MGKTLYWLLKGALASFVIYWIQYFFFINFLDFNNWGHAFILLNSTIIFVIGFIAGASEFTTRNNVLQTEVDELKRKKKSGSTKNSSTMPWRIEKIMHAYDALEKERNELLAYINGGCMGSKPQCLVTYLNNLPRITDNEYKRTH